MAREMFLFRRMVPLAIGYQVAPLFPRGVSCGFCGIGNGKATTGLRIASLMCRVDQP